MKKRDFILNLFNKIISILNINSSKKIPQDFLKKYNLHLEEIIKNKRGFRIFPKLHYDVGEHPFNSLDFECAFASALINKLRPEKILEIGSYRLWILGLLAHFDITTIDIRNRKKFTKNETVITCDAKNLKIPNESFDMIVSLCTIEHFGLGRYGDEFDINGDLKAFKEMIRVLKPRGHIIFTVPITRAQPTIIFNAHRIYSYEMIKKFCTDLTCVKEKFFHPWTMNFCSFREITTEPKAYDIYLGCWKK